MRDGLLGVCVGVAVSDCGVLLCVPVGDEDGATNVRETEVVPDDEDVTLADALGDPVCAVHIETPMRSNARRRSMVMVLSGGVKGL